MSVHSRDLLYRIPTALNPRAAEGLLAGCIEQHDSLLLFRSDGRIHRSRELAEQKRARELEKLRKDIEEERIKMKEFDRWLERLEHAEHMRHFIVLYASKSKSWQPKYRDWIEWASRQADRKHELGRQCTRGDGLRPEHCRHQ